MEYTNKELAEDYHKVVSQRGGGFKYCSDIKKKISNSGVDIPSFYSEHKTLDVLKTKGIGVKTKKILELILENGLKRARDLFYEEMINEARKSLREEFRDDIYNRKYID